MIALGMTAIICATLVLLCLISSRKDNNRHDD
jgi:hypothetical protein